MWAVRQATEEGETRLCKQCKQIQKNRRTHTMVYRNRSVQEDTSLENMSLPRAPAGVVLALALVVGGAFAQNPVNCTTYPPAAGDTSCYLPAESAKVVNGSDQILILVGTYQYYYFQVRAVRRWRTAPVVRCSDGAHGGCAGRWVAGRLSCAPGWPPCLCFSPHKDGVPMLLAGLRLLAPCHFPRSHPPSPRLPGSLSAS